RKLSTALTARLYYKLERVRQFDALLAVDNQTLLIGSLVPSVTLDTRDSPFTTTKGQITTFGLEYANPTYAGQTANSSNAVGYYRWTGASHWYFSLTKDIIWSNVVAGGFERSDIAGTPIPLIKLFR